MAKLLSQDIVYRRSFGASTPTESSVPMAVLVCADMRVLLRRNSDDTYLNEISEKVLATVLGMYATTFFLVHSAMDISQYKYLSSQVPQLLVKYPEKLLAFIIDEPNISLSHRTLLAYLQTRLNVSVKPPSNFRTFSWQRLGECVHGAGVTVIHEPSLSSLGIALDKELSFQDRAKLRARSSWI